MLGLIQQTFKTIHPTIRFNIIMKYIEQQHLGKVEIDINTSIAVRLIAKAVILVILYVKTFRVDIIDFISSV